MKEIWQDRNCEKVKIIGEKIIVNNFKFIRIIMLLRIEFSSFIKKQNETH